MTDTKRRVHTLAKELSVSSKAIIEKCAAEGIAIKNHMHILSAGLEATIREWFSVQQHATSSEDAKPVDLEKVHVKRAPRKTKKEMEAAATAAEAAPALSVVVETPSEPAAPIDAPYEETAPDAGRLAAEAPSIAPPEPWAPAPEAEPAAAATAGAGAVAEAPTPAAEPAKPATAGPQNIPAPAQLQGPKLIRMGRPDVIARPRPMERGPSNIAPPPILPPIEGRPRHHHGGGGGEADEEVGPGGRRRGPAASPNSRHRANPRRTASETPAVVGELLREWRDRDLIERRERIDHASGRGITGMRADETTKARGTVARVTPTRRDKVALVEPIIIKEFCAATGIAFPAVFRKLQESGKLATMTQTIDTETAQLIAMEFGIAIEVEKAKSVLDALRDEFAERERKSLKTRPPVVTVLGHVDHGKTSLLDRIRRTEVAAGEAGGITQHIGAYQVRIGERSVTFLDTPGHEAFTAMRARGAQLTDVVVLVVAADDGVMPQTIEAINHARAAKVPIVVALNKIDLPQSDVNKVFGQLAEQQLVAQEWGGDTDVIKTSAVSGEGVEELLAHLAALSDLQDLKADSKVPACGTVIEAERSDRHGAVARVLVQEGTLKVGATVVCGSAYGRIRALVDDRGRKIREAGPSTPVEVWGLDGVPDTSDRLYEVGDLARAKQVATEVGNERRAASLARDAKPITLESLLATGVEGKVPELNVVIKADVQGSVDVLKKTLGELSTDEVKVNILHAGVGTITESDVTLAHASQAVIIGFHVIPETGIQRLAEDSGVEIRLHKIIYNVTDEIRRGLEGLLAPTEKVESRGKAEVRQVFNISRVGRVAGCHVKDGVIARNHVVRVVRDGVPVKEDGALASLKRFKDDAREVRAGQECGIRIEGFDDVKPGDVIEAYEVIKVARKL